ncbi:MAG: PIN domain-containing protein [Armatimonadetes bacterium]|nr:PIN domain-containing protein [Armatimonadota bacterium]
MSIPITVDINVFVAAVAGGNDNFHSWPSPPPIRGNLAANVVGILNDAREFRLFLTEHILANVLRVLCRGYGWSLERAEEYVALLIEIAEASGGTVLTPGERILDCPDEEDNRILECAAASGAQLIITDDIDLLSMSPWRGTPILTSADFVKRTDVMRRSRKR